MTSPTLTTLVDGSGPQPRFVASQCAHCQHVAFPPRRRCSNCGRTELDTARIGVVGSVYSFSVVHLAKPGVTVPYALAIADFPGDIRVFGRLLDWEGRLAIGANVTAAQAPEFEQTGNPAADYRLRIFDGTAA